METRTDKNFSPSLVPPDLVPPSRPPETWLPKRKQKRISPKLKLVEPKTDIGEMWTSEKIYFDGDSFFQDLCSDIQSAKESISLEVYIFANDELGNRIANLLMAAVKRGVEVKVVVDGVGSPLWKFTFQSRLEAAGVQCKIYRRVPFNLLRFFPMIFTNFKNLFGQLSRRDHRKLFIIDKKIAYVGSLNIISYHLQEFFGKEAWRDTGVRVTSGSIPALLEAFESSWKSSLFHPVDLINLSRLVLAHNTTQKKYHLYLDFLHRIENAKTKIWLTTAYFVPSTALLKQLKEAAARKVDIRILTTKKTDVFIIRWLRSVFYLGLLKEGVRIFEYEPNILHAKSVLIDDFATVGSTNLNNRSFFLDQELDIVLTKSTPQLEKQFLVDLNKSKEIRAEDMQKSATFISGILARIALLFRKWL